MEYVWKRLDASNRDLYSYEVSLIVVFFVIEAEALRSCDKTFIADEVHHCFIFVHFRGGIRLEAISFLCREDRLPLQARQVRTNNHQPIIRIGVSIIRILHKRSVILCAVLPLPPSGSRTNFGGEVSVLLSCAAPFGVLVGWVIDRGRRLDGVSGARGKDGVDGVLVWPGWTLFGRLRKREDILIVLAFDPCAG